MQQRANKFLSAEIFVCYFVFAVMLCRVIFFVVGAFINKDYLHQSDALCRAFGSSRDGAPLIGHTADFSLASLKHPSCEAQVPSVCFRSSFFFLSI